MVDLACRHCMIERLWHLCCWTYYVLLVLHWRGCLLDRVGSRCRLLLLLNVLLSFHLLLFYVIKVVYLIVCKKVHLSVMVIVYARAVLDCWTIWSASLLWKLLHRFFNYCNSSYLLSRSFNFFPDWFLFSWIPGLYKETRIWSGCKGCKW